MWCTQVIKYGRSSRRRLEVQLHCSCYRVPHLSQSVVTISWTASKCGKGDGNAEVCFVIAVREHSDTRADEDVDDRPIVGHLPREICLNLSAVSSMYNVLKSSLIALQQAIYEMYLLSI